MNKKLRTLQEIIKATSDYGYPEAFNLSEEECKKHNLPSTGSGWKGIYSGERVRLDLREEAKKWIDAMPEHPKGNTKDEVLPFYDSEWDDFRYAKRWIRHFFNLEDEE